MKCINKIDSILFQSVFLLICLLYLNTFYGSAPNRPARRHPSLSEVTLQRSVRLLNRIVKVRVNLGVAMSKNNMSTLFMLWFWFCFWCPEVNFPSSAFSAKDLDKIVAVESIGKGMQGQVFKVTRALAHRRQPHKIIHQNNTK